MNTYRPPGAGAGAGSGAPSSPGSQTNYTGGQSSFGESRQSSFGSSTQSSSGNTQSSFGSQARGGGTTGAERDVAASLAGNVKEATRTASRAVKQQASEFAADVGHELSKTAEQQKARGIEAMQGFVRAINAAAAELETQSPLVAGYVRDTAERIGGFSSNVENRSVNELVKAASDLARQQPALFFGGAVAAGFALSRFLKSSADSHAESEDVPMTPDAPAM